MNFEDDYADEYIWEYTGPSTLSDVLIDLLGAMKRDGNSSSQEINEFGELLLAHKKEIENGYISVDWVITQTRYGEFMSYEDIDEALGEAFDPNANYEFTSFVSSFSYTKEDGENHYTNFEVE